MQGPQGIPGINGSNGFEGALGQPGIAGTNGRDGANGSNGFDGAPGIAGTNGRDGLSGADGAPGRDGMQGSPGAPGLNGMDGDNGAQGPAGPAGQPFNYLGTFDPTVLYLHNQVVSFDGSLYLKIGKETGYWAPPGPAWTLVLAAGATGAQGLPGSGMQGLPGNDGAQGLPGNDGAQGLPGNDGMQGLPGNDGAQGLPGNDGMQGLPGAAGAQGPAGPAGAGASGGITPLQPYDNGASYVLGAVVAFEGALYTRSGDALNPGYAPGDIRWTLLYNASSWSDFPATKTVHLGQNTLEVGSTDTLALSPGTMTLGKPYFQTIVKPEIITLSTQTPTGLVNGNLSISNTGLRLNSSEALNIFSSGDMDLHAS